ncbi:MAG: TlpA family protein disulfide reductase [Saccharospirillaceae bacterium]|nr:TlpA family protein disulfide reductase [Pseudomonadales bacterium]NRB80545.1 TlpA family protein disulfide reductase [Saccharospirillaceae bacterium]
MRKVIFITTLLFMSSMSQAYLTVGDKAFLPQVKVMGSKKRVDLSRLKGRVVFLEFWASWCVSCAKSFPIYNKVYNELKDQGVIFISVNTDSSEKAAKRFLKKNPADFLVVRDTKKKAVKTYEPRGYPVGYIIDREGNIVHVEQSVPKYEELKAKLEELI